MKEERGEREGGHREDEEGEKEGGGCLVEASPGN